MISGGDPDLHFSGVGSVILAQKHTVAVGIINYLKRLPVQNGMKTADRERECNILGDFFEHFT